MLQNCDTIKEVFKTIDLGVDNYLDFLCEICSFEARAYDKETIDRMVDRISRFANEEGFQVKRTYME